MELYVYDKTRLLLGVLESYEYLRWTRRYDACGDFEIKAATDDNIELLAVGNIVWKNDDSEAAFIEHLVLTGEEQEYITARGRFATSLLARRIIWGTEIFQDTLYETVRRLVFNHIIAPSDAARKIDGFRFYAPQVFDSPVNAQFSYRNLLEVITSLCEAAEVGFRTDWQSTSREFRFTLYQGGGSYAVFSRNYENLISQEYSHSRLQYANVGLVGGEGEGGDRQVAVVGDSTGENRCEIFVDAKDLREEDFAANYKDALIQRGNARVGELAEIRSFDAAINPHGNVTYRRDFDLGQIVRVVAERWGVAMETRIMEVEESYDSDGQSIRLGFGRGLLTLGKRLREGF